jgi:LysR family nitrogen assimilation transcriptional regulator
MRGKIKHELALNGLDLKVAIETHTLNLCMELAKRGAGYTMVPRCVILSPETATVPQWARIADLEIVWSLFENTRRSHGHAVLHYRRAIRRLVEERLARGDWTGATGFGRAG